MLSLIIHGFFFLLLFILVLFAFNIFHPILFLGCPCNCDPILVLATFSSVSYSLVPMVYESSPCPAANVTVFVGFNPGVSLIHVSYSRIHCPPSTSSASTITKSSSTRVVCPELSRLSLLQPKQVGCFQCCFLPFEIFFFDVLIVESVARDESMEMTQNCHSQWWNKLTEKSKQNIFPRLLAMVYGEELWGAPVKSM